jgi:hypothetical protein
VALEHTARHPSILEYAQDDQQFVFQAEIDLGPSPEGTSHLLVLLTRHRPGPCVHGCAKETLDTLIPDLKL